MKDSFFRSLSVKLTLAFIGVGIITILSVALIVGQQTQRDFNRFIRERIQASLAEDLTAYYTVNGSWIGIDHILSQQSDEGAPNGEQPRELPPSEPPPSEPPPSEPPQEKAADPPINTGSVISSSQDAEFIAGWQSPSQGFNPVVAIRMPFTIVDADGNVVYSATMAHGEEVGVAQMEKGTPLLVDGVRVGTLLITGPGPETISFNQNERGFVDQVWRTLLWGGLGALLLALVMGGFIAATLTRPLRVLTEATQDVARGNLGRQVNVQSRDELGDLAYAFNHMSSDLAHSVNLRRQMTADIAHDLRTPLSVILGYTEALDEGVLAPSQETYAILHDEAKHLSRLVEDLRTLSLAEAGELRLYAQSIHPEELLTRAIAAHKVQADQQGVTLLSHNDAELPFVQVDPDRMAQVLHNIVSNALRYTPQGGTILVSAASRNGGVEIAVQDSGQGIAPEHLAKVFERFYRVDAARQQTGESGLGLPIAKSLVEMHGGTITVASEVGKGTTFTIYLPQGKRE